jgi:GR25 family glycosyltransferase involved in LPS biosynthesis
MKDFFDRVFVINLARREDRWKEFQEGLPKDWPFRAPERFDAIDGSKSLIPSWFQAGKGAWGVYRSHLAIMEQQIQRDWSRVLYLEDDALFLPSFVEGAAYFLRSLPQGWHQAFLGGQLLKKKVLKTLPNGVRVPHNVNRAHAHALSLEGARLMYRHLLETKDWSPRQHFDHRMGAMHETGAFKVFAPKEWLVGQRASHSNILGREVPDRVWDGEGGETLGRDPSKCEAFAVLGPWGSGTSAVAGAMHHLGVLMGHNFFKITDGEAVQKNSFEAVALRRFIQESIVEPGQKGVAWSLKKPHAEIVKGLRSWIDDRREFNARKRGRCGVGGKYPLMCHPDIIAALSEAWDPIRWVRVRRDMEGIRKTQERRKWKGLTVEVAEQMEKWLDEYLEGRSNVVEVKFEEFRVDPKKGVSKLVAGLEISPSKEQIAAAVRFIRP